MCYRYYVEANENITPYLERLEKKYDKSLLEKLTLGDVYPNKMAITAKGGQIVLMNWGYKLFNRVMHNTRAESIRDHNYYDNDFLNHKCVIVASGFYEYDSGKNPYYINTSDSLLFMAGIYQPSNNLDNFSIITKDASTTKQIHSRVPVVLNGQQARAYLTNNLDLEYLMELTPSLNIKANYQNTSLF